MGIELYSAGQLSELRLNYVGNQISAGFPSPAEDYLENMLDLNRTLIKNPSSTFFGRVKGLSMKDAGVDHGDLLVIDKSLDYYKGALAVCFLDGEFTLKKVHCDQGRVWLIPANPDFQPIPVSAEADFMIWGIVTYIIKKAA